MYSSLQMAADLPENYKPLFRCFSIHQRRSNRLDSNYLEAEPGQYITVARKAELTTGL
jgi:hypothetical protein